MSNGRTVSTDALETLGTIIDASQKRDAIHLAVLPAQAGVKLRRGMSIKIEDGRAYEDESSSSLLIVDPFLPRSVFEGEWFWAILRPRLVTSLRHVWSHPAFPDEGAGVAATHLRSKEMSEAWLRDFCAKGDFPDYDRVMGVITGKGIAGDDEGGSIEGDYFYFYGTDAHGEIPPEFWDHVEVVTGKKMDNRPTYFSCSC